MNRETRFATALALAAVGIGLAAAWLPDIIRYESMKLVLRNILIDASEGNC